MLPDGKATRQAVLDNLDWLAASADANDVVLIFYAGHGERGERGEFRLLTAAYDPKRVAETTVTTARIAPATASRSQ